MPPLLTLALAAFFSATPLAHAQGRGEPPAATAYACPMKCEGQRTSPAQGNCPVCGMKLKLLPAAPAQRITTAVVTPAAPVVPGRETTLRISADTPLPNPATVSILRHDHGWSVVLPAAAASDGSLTCTATLPTSGDYTIIAEPSPANPEAAAARATLRVGDERSPSPMGKVSGELDPADGRPKRVGPYLVVLSTEQTPIAGRAVDLRFEITQSGSPVTDTEPCFGAPGHCLLMSEDLSAIATARPIDPSTLPGPAEMDCHVPGMDMTPEPGTPPPGGLVFRTVAAKPGLHRVWFRFRHCGQVHAAPFVVNVHPSDETETTR